MRDLALRTLQRIPGLRPLLPKVYKSWIRMLEARVERNLGIKTDLGERLRPMFEGDVGYEPVRYDALSEILAQVPLTPDDEFIDIGCGRGRAVCYAATLPVKRCVGIEFRADLAAAAKSNADRLKGRQSPVEIIEGNATKADYDGLSYFFMYNPFNTTVMTSFLGALRASLERQPRPLRIVYLNPQNKDLMEGTSWLRSAGTFTVPYRFSFRTPVAVFESIAGLPEVSPESNGG